jgi:Tol biopolymer transport system component
MRRLVLCVAVLTGLVGPLLASPAHATYVGREGKIAFVRANQIYTIAHGGGAIRKLTSSGKNYRPKWSPDGRRIAYLNEPSPGVRNVWTMSATGTNRTRVTSSGTVTTNPTWSPDGKRIAFGQGSDIVAQLFTVRAMAPFGAPVAALGYVTCAGGSAGCSDEDPADPRHAINVDRFIAWSPDGTQIALLNHDDRQFDVSISMYYPATGEERQVIYFGADCCGYADFTDLTFGPTGQFGLGENLNEGYYDSDIFYVEKITYPADQCRIYRQFGTCPPPTGPAFVAAVGDKSPAPSPTNAHMAFVNASTGTPNIYTSTIEGSGRRLLVPNGYQPDWQPLP